MCFETLFICSHALNLYGFIAKKAKRYTYTNTIILFYTAKIKEWSKIFHRVQKNLKKFQKGVDKRIEVGYNIGVNKEAEHNSVLTVPQGAYGQYITEACKKLH